MSSYSSFFPFNFISWWLITLQYCSGFCHTLTWISHGFTCVPHLEPPLTPSLWVFPVHQAGFRKGRGTRDQIANIHWIIEKAREFQQNIYFCFIDYSKAFDCVGHNKLWKSLQEVGTPDHLTCLLRNLYAGQEATELDMEQQNGSKQEKEYVRAVYCHLLI